MVNLDELKPGRELDALIAEKVEEFVWRRASSGCKVLVPATGPDADWAKLWTEELRGDEQVCRDGLRFVPPYSTDIAVAWQVLKQIGELAGPNVMRKYQVHGWLKASPEARTFIAITDFDFNQHGIATNEWSAHGNTLEEAICLAALKAMEGGRSNANDPA